MEEVMSREELGTKDFSQCSLSPVSRATKAKEHSVHNFEMPVPLTKWWYLPPWE